MADKSAGTLTVGVVAPTAVLDQNMKQGEQIVQRFRRSFDDQARAVERSSSRMDAGFKLSSEKMSRAFGVASGGLLMLAGSAEGVAGTVGGSLARAFGSFAAGGPIAAGVSIVSDGIAWIGKRSREAAAEAEKLREVQARQAAEAKAASERRRSDHQAYLRGLQDEIDALGRRNELEVDRRARTQAARLQAAGDADFAAGKDLTGPTAASRARELNRAEDADARARRFNDEFAAGRAQADARSDAANAAGWAATDRKVALRRELQDALRLAEATDEQRRHWADIQRIAELRRAGMEAEAQIAEQLLATTLKREAAEKAGQEAKRRSEAQGRADGDAARRVRDLQATTEMERLLNRHADERNALASQGVKLGEVLKAQAYELAQLKTREANEAERARDATERQAEAQANAAQQARFYADQQKEAASAASRASQMNTFGAGYGPLAQARDAKRRNSNIARFKNHADNLAAERRETSAYGNVGAPQFDADGNPIGIADPFAFDLGSVFSRRSSRKKSPSDYQFTAPGLFNPAYQFPEPAAPGMGPGGGGGGPTFNGPGMGSPTTPSNPEATDMRGAAGDMRAAGDAAKQASDDTKAAADETKAAADKFEQLAGATKDLAAAVGPAFDAAMAAAEEALDIANSVKSQLEASGFYGG